MSQTSQRTAITCLLLLITAFAFSACYSIPDDVNHVMKEMKESRKAYKSIKKTMTRTEVTAILGEPLSTNANKCLWECRYDEKNYESLLLEFNDEDQVVAITRTQSRESQGPLGKVNSKLELGE